MSSRESCRGCGAKTFRKGKRRAVLGEDGSVTIAIVCLECAKRAFSVVRPVGGAAHVCSVCKLAPARICTQCAMKARAQLVAPILTQLHALALGAEAQGQEDRADGMRAAMRALEQETEKTR
jgi:hypothetical protein